MKQKLLLLLALLGMAMSPLMAETEDIEPMACEAISLPYVVSTRHTMHKVPMNTTVLSSSVLSGDLYYNLDSVNMTAEVASNPSLYTGSIVIPTTVVYGTRTYTVTSIGASAFANCTGLTSIVIPNSITTIGLSAFNGSGLTSVIIPESVTSLSTGATFQNCSGLTTVEWNPRNCTIESYNGTDYYQPFNNLTSITSFIFGNHVDTIPANLCAGIKGSFSITIPSNVKKIGDWAFSNATGLNSLVISNGVEILGESAFNGCSSLTTVTIPESVRYLGAGATFQRCTGLTSVQWNAINCTLDSIGLSSDGKLTFRSPFYELNNLTSFTIGNQVEVLPANLCFGLKGLTSVTIPESVTSIGYGATFQQCTGLKSVEWNAIDCAIDLHKEINAYYPPFKNLTNITNFTIGDNVEAIPIYLCDGLSGLTSIVIPNSVKIIRGGGFYLCTGLTSIIIPDSVIDIGWRGFFGCNNLTSITIPQHVTNIGNNAFRDCTRFTFVASEALTPPALGETVFLNVPKSIPLYVQCSAVQAYKAAEQWQDFQIDDCKSGVIAQDCSQNGIQESLLQPGSPIETTTYTMTLYADGCETYNEYTCAFDQEVPITAIPNECYQFKQWSDGNRDNPRYVTITCDTAFTAIFELRASKVENATVTISDVCADDDSLYVHIDYTYDAAATYTITFDEKSVTQGFLPKYAGALSPNSAKIAIPIPQDASDPKHYVRPDIYSLDVSVLDECGSPYTVKASLTVHYPSWLLLQRWNDVLSVRNEDYNGGYEFSDIKWFHEGTPVDGSGEHGAYLYVKPHLVYGDAYWAELTRADDGVTITTCPYYPVQMQDTIRLGDVIEPYVTVTPNMVSSQNMSVTVKTNICGTYFVYNSDGNQLGRHAFCPPADGTFTIDLSPYHVSGGLYVIAFHGVEGSVFTTKVIVEQ